MKLIYWCMWIFTQIVWTPIFWLFNLVVWFFDGYGEYAVKKDNWYG